MGDRLRRECVSHAPLLATTLEDTPRVSFADFAGGAVRLPAASSITSLAFYGAERDDDLATFAELYDRSGEAVTLEVAADRMTELHDAVFGCAAIKIVADAAGQVFLSLKG